MTLSLEPGHLGAVMRIAERRELLRLIGARR
jgi:hypothetical protein